MWAFFGQLPSVYVVSESIVEGEEDSSNAPIAVVSMMRSEEERGGFVLLVLTPLKAPKMGHC